MVVTRLARLGLLLALVSNPPAQERERETPRPAVSGLSVDELSVGELSVGWDDVTWLDTRMHLRARPAPGALDASAVVVSIEPSVTPADRDAIAAESAALARLGRAMGGRTPLRVWLRPDARSPLDDRATPNLDGTAAADAEVFERYGFDGKTPRRIVLDHRGVVRRVVEGRLRPDDLEFLRTLLLEPAAASRLVGRPFPDAVEGGARRLSGAPLIEEGRWTLLRWWTNGCPFCEASLPAIDTLRARFPALDVVAVYHPKPPRAVGADAIAAFAAERGFGGPLASDAPRWSTFRALLELGLERGPTSISLLVGPDRTIRWVHPGPRLHPSPDGAHPDAHADFVGLEALLTRLFGDVQRGDPERAGGAKTGGADRGR